MQHHFYSNRYVCNERGCTIVQCTMYVWAWRYECFCHIFLEHRNRFNSLDIIQKLCTVHTAHPSSDTRNYAMPSTFLPSCAFRIDKYESLGQKPRSYTFSIQRHFNIYGNIYVRCSVIFAVRMRAWRGRCFVCFSLALSVCMPKCASRWVCECELFGVREEFY